MPRPLKVFRAHLGFNEAIVAAPSQKAALRAWGARPVEFAHGFAAVTHDETAIAAALAHPGVVLERPAGSNGPFKTHADAPKLLRLSRNAADRARRERDAALKTARMNKRRKAREAANAELAEIRKSSKDWPCGVVTSGENYISRRRNRLRHGSQILPEQVMTPHVL